MHLRKKQEQQKTNKRKLSSSHASTAPETIQKKKHFRSVKSLGKSHSVNLEFNYIGNCLSDFLAYPYTVSICLGGNQGSHV